MIGNGFSRHGFKLSEAGLLYALPGLVLLTIGFVMIFYPLYGMGLASLASGTHQSIPPAGIVILTNGAVISGIGTLLTLIGGFFSTPAAMHMAARNRVNAVLQIREWWAILSRAPGKFLSALWLGGGSTPAADDYFYDPVRHAGFLHTGCPYL